MTDDRTDEIVIPALMRAARGSYAAAIAERLEAAGSTISPATARSCWAGWPTMAAPPPT
jgi:hypothetical protein